VNTREFGQLGDISVMSLGGGGIGQVWGTTNRAEAIATVREAVHSGITLLDVAPSYGDGEAERVIGDTFQGALPTGLRVSTKCRLGNLPAKDVFSTLETSLKRSFSRMQLNYVDIFFLHGMIVPDHMCEGDKWTPWSLFVEAVRPAFEYLVHQGRIGAWGITGIGDPSTILDALVDDPKPAAVQVIANLLDSAGGLKHFEGPTRSREIIDTAAQHGVGVCGIRAVQAGALTDRFDRTVQDHHPDMLDYIKAEPFRMLAKEIGETPSALAHRYTLTMRGISTVVLGTKNREELQECMQAESKGALDISLFSRINELIYPNERA